MDFVKKNWINLAIAGVAVLAVVVLLVVIEGGMKSDLVDQMTARLKVQKDFKGVASQQRTLPMPDERGEPIPLDKFPSQPLIDDAKNVTADVARKASEVMQRAVDINRGNMLVNQKTDPINVGHTLLLPDALPAGKETSRSDFRREYNMMMWIPDKPELNPPGSIAAILSSAPPATEEEIRKELKQIWDTQFAPKLYYAETSPGVRTYQNLDALWAQFLRDNANFEQTFRKQRAEKTVIYMENGALSMSPQMDQAQAILPPPEFIWYAQQSFWVQRDVAQQIAKFNRGSSTGKINVYSSPIKHVIALTVRPGFDMYHLAQESAAGMVPVVPMAPVEGEEQPAPDAGSASEVPPNRWTRSPTGRVSNQMYDVIHSSLTVIADPVHVSKFLRALEAGNFITVLEVDSQVVDGVEAKKLGYDYGGGPVVALNIQLEHLFLRQWTAHAAGAPMPREVQTKLGVRKPLPAGGGGETTAMAQP